MTRLEAVLEIYKQGQSDRTTKAGMKRTLKALETLGLQPGLGAITEVMQHMDFFDRNGQPWNHLK